MSANTITSTFETTILEFCEAASWINSQLIELNKIVFDDIKLVLNRIDALQPTAEKYISSFKKGEVSIKEENTLRLENVSSTLWNTIVIALKNQSLETDTRGFLCRCQLFTSILLSVYNSLCDTDGFTLRSFKCFIYVLKTILDCKKFETWEITFKNAHMHAEIYLKVFNERLSKIKEQDRIEFQKNSFEFYLLTFQKYFQDKDMETAKLYLTKVDLRNNIEILDPDIIVEIVRIIYNATLDRYNSQEANSEDSLTDMIFYLNEAHSYLSLPIKDIQSHIDYSTIKYSLLSFLVQCLIGRLTKTSIDDDNISNILDILQGDYPRKATPFQLRILYHKERKDSNIDETVSSIIMQMILSIDITSNFEVLLSSINDFSKSNTTMALRSLDYLFLNKLDCNTDQSVTEKALLSRFYITLQSEQLNETEMITSLEEFYIQMEKKLTKHISVDTMSCLVTLLWNSGKKVEKLESYLLCSRFYRLALKSIISDAYADRGKLQRALISAYISAGELNNAEQILQKITVSDKKFSLTSLLNIRLCVAKNEISSIGKYFEELDGSVDKKSIESFILALNEVRGFPDILLKGVLLLFSKLHLANEGLGNLKKGNWALSVTDIARYTIQTVVKFREEMNENLTAYIEKITLLLNESLLFLKNIKTQKFTDVNEDTSDHNKSFIINTDEIEWFASMAYNIVINLLQENNTYPVMEQLASIALEFIELVSYDDFSIPKMCHYKYWAFRCKVLCTIVQNRCTPNMQTPPSVSLNNLGLPSTQDKFDELLNEVIRFKSESKYEQGVDEEQKNNWNELLKDIFQLKFDKLLTLRDYEGIEDLLAIEEKENDFSLDWMLVECILEKDNVPSELKKKVILLLYKRNLANPQKIENVLCYWLRSIYSDCDLQLSIDEQTLFSKLLTRIKLNCDEVNKYESDFMLDIENICSICWNVGINYLMAENRDEMIHWSKLAFEFSRFARPGLDVQLKGLLSSLCSTVKMEPSQIIDVCDEIS